MTTETHREPGFRAEIFLGLREGYGKPVPYYRFREGLQRLVEREELCVTVTATEYAYPGGGENGVIIGLINYPRFPRGWTEFYDLAMRVAKELRELCGQIRVTVRLDEGSRVWHEMIGPKEEESQ